MIEVQHVHKVYRHQTVLRDVSITIPTGACVGVMGKSGSGKSTLGRIVAGIEHMTQGNLLKDGNSLGDKRFKRGIVTQVVFQNAVGSVNPRFTVEEVLQEALRFRLSDQTDGVPVENEGTRPRTNVEMMKDALAEVGLSQVELSQRAISLSGGQLQRLCLARAVLMKPDLIILDEALSGLDPLVQRDMLRLLVTLRDKQGMSMLFISHDLGSVYYLCDSLYVLHQGEVAWECDSLDDWSYEDLEKEMVLFSGENIA